MTVIPIPIGCINVGEVKKKRNKTKNLSYQTLHFYIPYKDSMGIIFFIYISAYVQIYICTYINVQLKNFYHHL